MTCTDSMTSLLTRCLGIAYLIAGLPTLADDLDGRPNIVFILADDQRSDVLGCYGNELIKTPTLDRLAEQGARFENSFCEVPICAASRASTFTGLTQRTHGYNFGELPVPAKYLGTSYPTLLKGAGYRTGFAGKYGVNFASPGLKAQFDFFRGINRNPYLKEMPDGSIRHETDLCADAAIEFIKSTPADQPFCMSVNFNAAHAEDGDKRPGHHFQWPESANGLYEDVTIPDPPLSEEKFNQAMPPFLRSKSNLNTIRYFWRWDTPEKYQTNIRAYYRMISGIDHAVGRILACLKSQNLEENTIVIYTADNGFMMGDRRTAGKWNHFEQSLRVPLIIFDPRIPEAQRGKVIKPLVSNIDLASTLTEFAGIKVPEVHQGRSLVPHLQSSAPADWRDDLFFEHKFKHFNDWTGIRNSRYKFAVYHDEPDGPYECLYDLEKDPDELINLADHPEYRELRDKMQRRLDEYHATLTLAPAKSDTSGKEQD